MLDVTENTNEPTAAPDIEKVLEDTETPTEAPTEGKTDSETIVPYNETVKEEIQKVYWMKNFYGKGTF